MPNALRLRFVTVTRRVKSCRQMRARIVEGVRNFELSVEQFQTRIRILRNYVRLLPRSEPERQSSFNFLESDFVQNILLDPKRLERPTPESDTDCRGTDAMRRASTGCFEGGKRR